MLQKEDHLPTKTLLLFPVGIHHLHGQHVHLFCAEVLQNNIIAEKECNLLGLTS